MISLKESFSLCFKNDWSSCNSFLFFTIFQVILTSTKSCTPLTFSVDQQKNWRTRSIYEIMKNQFVLWKDQPYVGLFEINRHLRISRNERIRKKKVFVISLCEENTISWSTDAYLCLLLGTVNEQYHHGNHDYPFSQVILHGPSTSTRKKKKNFNFLFVTKKWRFCSFLVLYLIFIQANFSEWRTDILSYSSCNCHDGKSPWV